MSNKLNKLFIHLNNIHPLFIINIIHRSKENRFSELIEVQGLIDGRIQFSFKPNKLLTTSIVLKNISRNKVAYKFKTTNPKVYSVQPNQNIIHPSNEVNVEFTMQPRQQFTEQISDKFLIDVAELTDQILQIEEDTTKILKEHVHGSLRIETQMIKQTQAQESSEFNQGSVSQRDTTLASSNKLYSSMGSGPNEEEKRLNESLIKAKNDYNALLQQNKDLERKYKELQKIQESNSQEANFSMFHVIIIAIIGLIAGAFLTR